ncbi:MAG: hypothetical protein OEZ39_15965 [Gammaproteobacteria bacterium]|nr:hypothetical protein [Gammaproteobacteria bacterium]MDH5653354.1 hypothetical protein [Gammaproteobacteria bacterium]
MLTGICTVLWGVWVIISGQFVWGGNYTPEGRDSGIVIFAIIAGCIAVGWGCHELKLDTQTLTDTSDSS